MIDADQFRTALGQWASGVTIVTSAEESRVHGMTALVLVCADKSSITNELIEKSGVYAAHILASGQQDLSNKFASKKDEHRRFEGIDWKTLATGAPILPGCLAVLDCRVSGAHDAGDHIVYVGLVEAIELEEQEPLVYFQGAYRELGKKA
jgi:flavin reductase (DIM6/NTAB) family NADH-FMN oxidoreductase RutF